MTLTVDVPINPSGLVYLLRHTGWATLARQIEEQLNVPPRPPEPGIGSVVKDKIGVLWVRVPNGLAGSVTTENWVCGPMRCRWEHIEEPTILKEWAL